MDAIFDHIADIRERGPSIREGQSFWKLVEEWPIVLSRADTTTRPTIWNSGCPFATLRPLEHSLTLCPIQQLIDESCFFEREKRNREKNKIARKKRSLKFLFHFSFFSSKKMTEETKIASLKRKQCGGYQASTAKRSAKGVKAARPPSPFVDVRLPSAYLGDVDVNVLTLGNDTYQMYSFVPGLPGYPDVCVKCIDGKLNHLVMDQWYPLKELLRFQATTVQLDQLKKNALIIADMKSRPQPLSEQDEATLDQALKYNNPVDIHFVACLYVKFVQKFFQMNNSIPSPILVSVHDFAENVDNAFFLGDSMRYGNGDIQFRPMGSIDVGAHEIGHSIVKTLAGLEYLGESGALNESFADIFGAAFEFIVYRRNSDDDKSNDLLGSSDWTIGEDVCKRMRCLRDMANPESCQQPSKYGAPPFWKDPSKTDEDYGGVHINSGVSNHCFYQLATRISLDSALKVFIDCLSHLGPKSQFKDFAKALRASGTKLSFATPVEESLQIVGL